MFLVLTRLHRMQIIISFMPAALIVFLRALVLSAGDSQQHRRGSVIGGRTDTAAHGLSSLCSELKLSYTVVALEK